MLWSLNKISQLIFQRNVWRSVWRTRTWILDLKGKVLFGLRQEMDFETLAKLSTEMFLCKPSRERLLQRNGPEWAKERPSNVLWFIVLGTQQLYFSRLKIYDFFLIIKNRLHWSSWYGKRSNHRCPAFRLFRMGWQIPTRSKAREVKFPVRSRQESGCLVPS